MSDEELSKNLDDELSSDLVRDFHHALHDGRITNADMKLLAPCILGRFEDVANELARDIEVTVLDEIVEMRTKPAKELWDGLSSAGKSALYARYAELHSERRDK